MNGVSGQGAFDAAVAGASLLPQAMSISDMVIGSSTCFIDELRITASPARHRTAADCRRRCCPAQRQPSVARSEEHTSELQSLMRISYAVFCLKKKKPTQITEKNKKTQ